MRLLLSVLLLCCCNTLFCQDSTDGKKVFVKEFNWHIVIPSVYDTVSAKYMDKMSEKGRKMIEDATDIKVEAVNKNLFTYRNKFVNYIMAEYQQFDPVKDGSYKASYRLAYDVVYETLKKQFEGKAIDTSHAVEKIDGLLFERFSVKITLNENSQMSFYLFNHLFGKKDLTVSIVYFSLLEGALVLDAMRKSTFGKK